MGVTARTVFSSFIKDLWLPMLIMQCCLWALVWIIIITGREEIGSNYVKMMVGMKIRKNLLPKPILYYLKNKIPLKLSIFMQLKCFDSKQVAVPPLLIYSKQAVVLSVAWDFLYFKSISLSQLNPILTLP